VYEPSQEEEQLIQKMIQHNITNQAENN
jgi:hypothetical protein